MEGRVHADPSEVYAWDRRSAQLRLAIIETHRRAGSGHLGSALSIVEILVVLFGKYLRALEATEGAHCGDRFVLSKGHAALALYCLLALEGRIPMEQLSEFGLSGGVLEPHPNERREPLLHASTGSLGQGLSVGVGLALGSRLQGRSDRTFVLIGDGEANEGQIWEAARCAAVLGLGNLVVILDDNEMQQDGPTPEVMPVTDLTESWARMGWRYKTVDGHDCDELDAGLAELLASDLPAPRLLRARTVKGRGVPFLEGCTESHFPPPLTPEELALVRYAMGGGTRDE